MDSQASAATSTTSVSQTTTENSNISSLVPATIACDKDAASKTFQKLGVASDMASGLTSAKKMRPPLGFDRFEVPATAVNCFEAAEKLASQQRWWRQTRIHVALLGLAIGAVNCYAQATFCIAIVEMVLPTDYVIKPIEAPTNQPAANATLVKLANGLTTADNSAPTIGLLEEHSCPIEFKYRNFYDSWRFPDASPAMAAAAAPLVNGSRQAPTTPNASQVVDMSNRFNWDATQQGLLLGAFAFGMAPLQIVGGRLAEIYGSKWVLLIGCIGTALTNLTIPYIAHFSFLLLLVNRIVMGIAQAGMEPGLMCLLADWLTPKEAGFFISMLLFAICFGFFLGSLCSSLILGLGYGWPLAYYVSGGLNLAVAIVWYIFADSWPHASKHIDQRELDYITHEQRRQRKLELTARMQKQQLQQQQPQQQEQQQQQQPQDLKTPPPPPPPSASKSGSPSFRTNSSSIQIGTGMAAEPSLICLAEQGDPMSAPWLNILTTRSVWAFIICKISVRWCVDVLSNELPTYLANVLHLSIKINGLLASISTALFMISSFVTGWLVSEIFVVEPAMMSTNNSAAAAVASAASKTRIRKVFQSIASFGSVVCIVLMTHYDCDIVFSMSMMLILSWCLVMGTGGEMQIPYDMTSRYPGTLHGMACTLSVSGWLAPPLIGLILGDQPSSRYRWSIVWLSTAAITLVGGLVFVLFADSSPRDFDTSRGPAASARGRRRKRARCAAAASGRLSAQDLQATQDQQRKQSAASLCHQGDTCGGDGGGGDDGDDGDDHGDDYGDVCKPAAYVNGALNSSSCESSPKSGRPVDGNQPDLRLDARKSRQSAPSAAPVVDCKDQQIIGR